MADQDESAVVVNTAVQLQYMYLVLHQTREHHARLPDIRPNTNEVSTMPSLCRSLSHPCRLFAGSSGSGSYAFVVRKLVVLYSAPEHAPPPSSYTGMGKPLLLRENTEHFKHRSRRVVSEAGGVKVAVRGQQVFYVLADAESSYHVHCSCTEHKPGVYVWVAKAVSRRKRALGPKILL